jgi:hypothetical protein
MVSAGSEVPSIIGACDFAGTRDTDLCRRRPAAAVALALLSCLLLQGCGTSETKGMAEAEPVMSRASLTGGETVVPRGARAVDARDSFADRYPRDSFSDRYSALGLASQTAPEVVFAPQSSHVMAFASQPAREVVFAKSVREMPFAAQPARENPQPVRETAVDRPVRLPSTSYRVAALTPMPAPSEGLSVLKQSNTRLVGFDNSAFPYSGKSPRGSGSRYTDNRVLVHVPPGFDARKPGVIVVFFHGHGATLERDVRDRQALPKQITESGINAVLVAPQLAYDAADSSAGKFWERDGLKRFMAEAADQLARTYGDPRSAEIFANMPVVIVAYSGGFETAASSLQVGGLGKRVTGVVLLDALYGHLDKFSSWIAKNRHAFFVSSYTTHNKRRDDNLAEMLRAKNIPVQYELDGPMRAGTVAFLSMGDIRHRDFVTLAWTQLPVKDILVRMARR